ncbi:MAG: anti-sigma factor [Sphingobium sp.]
MDEPLSPTEKRSALAAELALGVLEGAERAEALRLQLLDPGFAEEVRAWEARLAPLHGAWGDVTPHDAVWDAVAARIGGPAGDRKALVRWRAGALMSGAIAAGLAAILLWRPPLPRPAGPAPTAIAQMVGAPDGPLVAARYDPGSARMTVRIAGIEPGRLAPELWVIPAGGAPVSLGGIGNLGTTLVPLSDAQRQLLVEGATLAVTLEPATGMPHAGPSSAPIAAGKISIL